MDFQRNTYWVISCVQLFELFMVFVMVDVLTIIVKTIYLRW